MRAPGPPEMAEQLARKNARTERREALYMVVRDAMVRAGVLSAGYKFKVLSLDPTGQQFVVMIDLGREYGASTARLSEMENLIAQSAKARFELVVTAVYWRLNDNAAVGVRMRRAADKEAAPATASVTPTTIRAPIMPVGSYEARASAPAPLRVNSGLAPLSGRSPLHSSRTPLLDSAPAPLRHSAPAPLRPTAPAPLRHSAPSPLITSASPSTRVKTGAPVAGLGQYDPIEDDEVAAFKRALNGSAGGASAGAPRRVSAVDHLGTTVRSGPMSSSPLLQSSVSSGFADTELPSDSASSDLSATQYGDL